MNRGVNAQRTQLTNIVHTGIKQWCTSSPANYDHMKRFMSQLCRLAERMISCDGMIKQTDARIYQGA